MKSTHKKILLLLTTILLVLPLSSAVLISVDKATLDFDNVLREGYAEESFLVSSDGDFIVSGEVEVEGPISEWVSFIPQNVSEEGFTFSADSPQEITVIVEPPVDAANDQYQGSIRVLTGELARTDGGLMGSTSRAAFLLRANVEVTGTEQLRCNIGGVRVTSTELDQEFDVRYSIQNSGNVRVQPTLDLRIYDQLQENLIEETSFTAPEQTLPTTRQQFIDQVSNNLEEGQYWVVVSSDDCSGGGLFTFDVLERGGILDQGELIALEASTWNDVGDIIPITGVFRNNGDRTVSAQLRGTITQNGNVVKVIDTDNFITPPGETARIESFFNPDSPGQYEIRARVLYNNKLTYERTTIINVTGEPLTAGSNLWTVVFVMAIGILLFLIIKKKKQQKNRHAH